MQKTEFLDTLVRSPRSLIGIISVSTNVPVNIQNKKKREKQGKLGLHLHHYFDVL